MTNDKNNQNEVAGPESEATVNLGDVGQGLDRSVKPTDDFVADGDLEDQICDDRSSADAFCEAAEAAGLDEKEQRAICANYVESFIEDVVFYWVDQVSGVDYFMEYVEEEIAILRIRRERNEAWGRENLGIGETDPEHEGESSIESASQDHVDKVHVCEGLEPTVGHLSGGGKVIMGYYPELHGPQAVLATFRPTCGELKILAEQYLRRHFEAEVWMADGNCGSWESREAVFTLTRFQAIVEVLCPDKLLPELQEIMDEGNARVKDAAKQHRERMEWEAGQPAWEEQIHSEPRPVRIKDGDIASGPDFDFIEEG